MGKNRTATISAEPANLGDYTIIVRGWDDVMDTEHTAFSHTLHLDDVRFLIQHLDNAYEDLMERRVKDAICGDCDVCGNTRMIYPLRFGHPSAEHCPVCSPKLADARTRGLLR